MDIRLEINLLGGLAIRFSDDVVPILPTRKATALLVYLAAEGAASHRRESLFTLMWPGMPEKSARHNLSQTLYQLSQFYTGLAESDPAPLLLTSRSTVQLNPDAKVQADVREFDRLLDETRFHGHPDLHNCPDCLANLQAAVDLYRGEFLADFYLEDSNLFEDWVTANREAYRQKVLSTLETLANALLNRQDFTDAQSMAERQVEIDPLGEPAYRTLMRIQAQASKKSDALRTYRRLADLFQSELGSSPSPETTRLYESISGEDLRQTASPMAQSIRGYEVRSLIGSGYTGDVFRAYQPLVGREVAIKVIQPQFANRPDFIRRFEVEAQLAARLEHPHIVPLYDYWREPSGAYLVMRLLRGGSLAEALKRGPWSPRAAVQLVDQIASALDLAHRQGVVHRDVKPGNIMLDEDSQAYLVDFGIATLVAPIGQQNIPDLPDGSSGSLGYLPPELAGQNGGASPTRMADIYSLGVILYELLTGVHPFPGLAGEDLIAKHLREPLPPVRTTRPEMPESVDAVIQRATAKAPDERYQDVLSLASAFRRSLLPWDTPVPFTQPAASVVLRNPYKGLRAFQEADAGDFYGREDLVQRLLARISLADGSPGTPRFLAVVGPSGSGKSSVVRAGLIPALRQGKLPGSAGWFVVDLIPGSLPLDNLANALLQVASELPDNLQEMLKTDPKGLVRVLHHALPGPGNQVLLFIDQFEELFTLVESDSEREHFLDLLVTAASDPHSPARLVVTLRADFYDRPLQHPAVGELIRQATEVVLPLSRNELARTIRVPAERAGLELEADLLSALVADVSEQPGGLPLLQYTLTELADNRQDGSLTLRAYQNLGGVLGALAKRAEAIYQDLGEPERQTARQLFLRLVTLGEGIEDTRRRVLRSELQGLVSNDEEEENGKSQLEDMAGLMDRVIEHFGRRRLLTFDHEPASRKPTVEIAHEALLREWPRLREWLDESREDVRNQRILATAAAEWQEGERDQSFLLRGVRLAKFSGWMDESGLALTAEEKAFLEASLHEQQARLAEQEAARRRELEAAREIAQQEKQAARRLAARNRVITAVGVVAILVAFAATFFWRQSQEQARLAYLSDLSAQVLLQPDQNFDPAWLLFSVEAYRQADTLQTRRALFRSWSQFNPRLLMPISPLEGKFGFVAFRPEDSLLVVMESPNLVQFWDLRPESATFGSRVGEFQIQLVAIPRSTAFNPDGTILAIGFRNGQIGFWNADPGSDGFGQHLVKPLTIFSFEVTDIDFNPNGERLAVAGSSGAFQIIDTQPGSATFGKVIAEQLKAHDRGINTVYYSPDGQALVSTGNDGNIKFWHTEPGSSNIEQLKIIRFYDDFVFPLFPYEPGPETYSVLSRDGKILAASSGGAGFVQLFNAGFGAFDLGEPLAPLISDSGISVTSFALDPDHRILAFGSTGKTVILLDTDLDSNRFGQPITKPLAHVDDVTGLAFSPNGRWLASMSEELVQIWDVSPFTFESENLAPIQAEIRPDLVAVRPPILKALAYSPDGGVLASGGDDHLVHLWNSNENSPAFGQPIGEPLSGHEDDVQGLVFSPDGRRLVSSGREGAIRIWDVEISSPTFGHSLKVFQGHSGQILGLALSQDGDLLASGSVDRTIRLWDLAGDSGAPIGEPLSGHSGQVLSLALSPDGSLLASGGRDTTIRLWNVDRSSPEFGQQALDLSGEVGKFINTLAFSPDGSLLASGREDGSILLWDLAQDSPGFGQPVLEPLPGHEGPVRQVAFHPDGSMLASAGQDGMIMFRDVATGQPLGAPIPAHTDWVYGLAFHPGGLTLASASADGMIRFWASDPLVWSRQVCLRAGRNLSEQEWRAYLYWAGSYDPDYKTCPQWP